MIAAAAVRDALATAEVDGLAIRIPDRLDGATYAAVNNFLERLGGSWDRRAKAHLFSVDPQPALQAFLAGGDAPPARSAVAMVVGASTPRTPAAAETALPLGQMNLL